MLNLTLLGLNIFLDSKKTDILKKKEKISKYYALNLKEHTVTKEYLKIKYERKSCTRTLLAKRKVVEIYDGNGFLPPAIEILFYEY